ncbi:diaminopimelate decarboxylase [Moraxella nasovis]|nr:diaminopimelate decarboxylase [Moraxella nasovis]UNU72826.1 diaminopimelate decarboxylase [Moraxella nasovis]
MTDSLTIDPITLTDALPFIEYRNNHLHIDGVNAHDLASTYQTPLYVYSKNAILGQLNAYKSAFSAINHQICFAVKSCSNLAVLKLLAKHGAGFDIVSKGELARVLQVTDGKKVVYSGVGKTSDDIAFALQADIDCFNVEAMSELDLIDSVAKQLNKKARISIRVNPDVDAKTHPYISTGMRDNKFGIYNAIHAYQYAKSLTNLEIVGIDCHIGSQILEISPFKDALDKIIELIDELSKIGIKLHHIDLGGGLGVRYIDENPASIQDLADELMPKLKALGLTVYLEPGRNIVANAGVLLTKVDVLKPTEFKNFAVTDASMCELLRPALYQSVMAIIPATLTDAATQTWTLVGSVCESSDVLGDNRNLALSVGDLLAITGAGAYGFSMASNYNSRPRPAEILCDNGTHRTIRQRETLEDLWRGECA